MSTPSARSSDSATSPPPPSPSEEVRDTASSVLAMGPPPGVTVQFMPEQQSPEQPNTAFVRRMRDTRTRSVSPRPRRAISPSLSVAQSRVRAAKTKADVALSRAGTIADQTIRAQATADDAIVEARAVRGEVGSWMVEMTRRAEANTSRVLGDVTGEVKRVMEQTQAQTSHTVGSAVQRWAKEIEVAASGATVMAESVTRLAVAEAQNEFKAQFDQIRAESQRREAEMARQVDEVDKDSVTLLSN